MARVYCVLDTSGYKHILRVCNNFCFSTPTMVTRTSLNVTLYVHCLVSFLVVLLFFLFLSLFVIRIIMQSLSSVGFSDADPSDGEPRNRPKRTHRVSGSITQLFLNLDTRRGCVVSITPRPSLPPEKTRYPLYRRLGGPPSRSG
jgi:hypothetical protein